MTNEEKLQNFQKMTMEDARKKADAAVNAYQKSMDEEFEEYKAMKEEQMEAMLKAERDNLVKEKNKVISLEQIRLRHEYTKRYEELKEKLFSEVNDRLSQYMETPAYERLLVKQIRKAMKFARGEQIIIYIDPADQEHVMSLEAATGAPLTISEYSFGGGTRAVLPERNVLIDDSFETKVKEKMESFSFGGGETNGR